MTVADVSKAAAVAVEHGDRRADGIVKSLGGECGSRGEAMFVSSAGCGLLYVAFAG